MSHIHAKNRFEDFVFCTLILATQVSSSFFTMQFTISVLLV